MPSFLFTRTNFTGVQTHETFRSFDHPVISFWSQGISAPSLVQIVLSALKLEMKVSAKTQTPPFEIYMLVYL
jgi:hypothetical protein